MKIAIRINQANPCEGHVEDDHGHHRPQPGNRRARPRSGGAAGEPRSAPVGLLRAAAVGLHDEARERADEVGVAALALAGRQLDHHRLEHQRPAVGGRVGRGLREIAKGLSKTV